MKESQHMNLCPIELRAAALVESLRPLFACEAQASTPEERAALTAELACRVLDALEEERSWTLGPILQRGE